MDKVAAIGQPRQTVAMSVFKRSPEAASEQTWISQIYWVIILTHDQRLY